MCYELRIMSYELGSLTEICINRRFYFSFNINTWNLKVKVNKMCC